MKHKTHVNKCEIDQQCCAKHCEIYTACYDCAIPYYCIQYYYNIALDGT